MSKMELYKGNPCLTSNEISQRHGNWIGDKDPTPDKPIEYIYFIYIRVQNNQRQHLYVRQYREKLSDIGDPKDLRGIEQALLLNARRSSSRWYGRRIYDPVGINFSDMSFVEEDCYFTIVIDERDWKFNPSSADISEMDDFVVFRKSKIEYVNGDHYIHHFDENDAFFGLTRNPIIDPDDGTERDSIRCIFRPAGPYRSGEEIIKQYALDIYVRAPFDNGGNFPESWLTVVFDPKVPSTGPG